MNSRSTLSPQSSPAASQPPPTFHRLASVPPPRLSERGGPHRRTRIALLVWLAMCLGWPATAATLLVWPDSPRPASPYADWETAARTIQEAVDAAHPGDRVVVTNGVYATGGRVRSGALTNRLVVDKPLTVESLGGPEVTVIQGYQVPGTTNGDGAVRCVYLTNGAVLSGFTLTGGATLATGDTTLEKSGGGVWCESTNAWVTNCTITDNWAAASGGGAYAGTLDHCIVTGNWAQLGGGGACNGMRHNSAIVANSAAGPGGAVYNDTLHNCTLTENRAPAAGAAYGGSLNNCIVYHNNATTGDGPNYRFSTLNYCCTIPLPTGGGGNITNEPQLLGAFYLSATSPCRGAGNAAFASGVDLDGEPWLNPPSIGCDEFLPNVLSGPLAVTLEIARSDVSLRGATELTGCIIGRATHCIWDFGDGLVLSNRLRVSHAWGATGNYTVQFRAYNESYPDGVLATVIVRVVNHYVSAASLTPLPPYASWQTAALTIQEAVDATTGPGALVLVTNGVYATGGRAVCGTMTNRVAVDKAITLQSVNGPEVTVIEGHEVSGASWGAGAIRCVYLTNGAVLSGFTLTRGATLATGDTTREMSGGGVWCESTNALVTNCTLTANAAAASGGGAYSGTLTHCTLLGNRAQLGGGGACNGRRNNCLILFNSAAGPGGGAYNDTLHNCTLTDNQASSGGAAYGGSLNNCILYYNNAPDGPNYSGSVLSFCCTIPLPGGGSGNMTNEPQVVSAGHLSVSSPCRGAGSAAFATGVDLDGEPWLNPPSIGCDEFSPDAPTGPLSVTLEAPRTTISLGGVIELTGWITGRVTHCTWDFGDGLVLSNRFRVSHVWGATGDYTVEFRAFNESHPEGVLSSLTVRVVNHYVSAGSLTPLPPYSSWQTAAQTIQEAVDATTGPGALVLVTNGVYATGGRAVHGTMTNRVAVDKAITVRSVNGPGVTVIQGYQVPGTTNGNGAIRCVHLTNGAVLSGFTLTQGATRAAGDSVLEQSGGGVWCESPDALLTNCLVRGNAAMADAGGVCRGRLDRCLVTDNSAGRFGGGAAGGVLNNCVLARNLAGWDGGAIFGGLLTNCTLVANWTKGVGGGAMNGTLRNCIVYYNTADSLSPGSSNTWCCDLVASCTTPGSILWGNLTNEPRFVDWPNGNFRLQSNSPCLNAGSNALASGTADLDGRLRVVGGTVDMGAYEFQGPGFSQFIPWLAQAGLPCDGSADASDPDGDGLNNWQEWQCATDPADPSCALRLLAPTPSLSGVTLTWPSVTNRSYCLERSTNLAAHPAFLPLAIGLPGQPGTTSFTDSNPPSQGPVLYRVGTQP